MRPADQTFLTKTEAERWLIRAEAEILDGDWIDPDAGRVPFGEYAADWIAERPNLRPKTIRLYRYLLRGHLLPFFGNLPLNRLTRFPRPAMAEGVARLRSEPGHHCQGVSAAQGRDEHCSE
jgi:hypothetical protein